MLRLAASLSARCAARLAASCARQRATRHLQFTRAPPRMACQASPAAPTVAAAAGEGGPAPATQPEPAPPTAVATAAALKRKRNQNMVVALEARVPEGAGPQRLDAALLALLPQQFRSLSASKRSIRRGELLVQGSPAQTST